MLTSHNAFMNETRANMHNQATQLNNQAAQLRNLKVQMGQMASLLTERQHGSLPSNSEVNPRGEGKEYCKAITLRSGRELEIPRPQPAIREPEIYKVSSHEIREQSMIIISGKRPRNRQEQMNLPCQFRILRG